MSSTKSHRMLSPFVASYLSHTYGLTHYALCKEMTEIF
ncbi:hypothetical protein SVAN01_10994 [Stagonosporopsis vannaccii]|nr:hypothetical protein SVAN01_10994 [Stagonosporopsis vannaccii]